MLGIEFSYICFFLPLYIILIKAYRLWSHGCDQKYLSLLAVPPAPVQVPSQRPFAPRVASVTPVANDKDDNF